MLCVKGLEVKVISQVQVVARVNSAMDIAPLHGAPLGEFHSHDDLIRIVSLIRKAAVGKCKLHDQKIVITL